MSDTVLLQYLHEELDDVQRARLDEQLAVTPALARRLDTLRHRSARLSNLLGSLDPTAADIADSEADIRPLLDPEPQVLTHERWWRSAGVMRAAAVLALLLGGVLIVEPVRAWVLDRVRAAAEVIGLVETAPLPRPPVLEPADAADPAGAPARFSVPWTAGTFVVEVDVPAGTLVIARGPEGSASAEIARAGGSFITFVPLGLRIGGAATPETVYTVTLPPSVRTVRLVRDRAARSYPIDDGELRLPLR